MIMNRQSRGPRTAMVILLIITFLLSGAYIPVHTHTTHASISSDDERMILPQPPTQLHTQNQQPSLQGLSITSYQIATTTTDPDNVIYHWVDGALSQDAQKQNPGDDQAFTVKMPFSFNYNGIESQDLSIDDNGGIIFGATVEQPLVPNNRPITDTNTPNNLIAPFWDDLDTTKSELEGFIATYTVGESPHRRFIVEWHKVQRYSNSGKPGDITIQVIFYEGTNNLKFQYRDVDLNDVAWTGGRDATVGLRGSGPEDIFVRDTKAELLTNGLAICFRHPNADSWCDALPVERITFDSPRRTGDLNTPYTFTARVDVPTTALPITYIWEADGQTTATNADTPSHTNTSPPWQWNTYGAKTITVKAYNRLNPTGKFATAVHRIYISDPTTPISEVSFDRDSMEVSEGDGRVEIVVKRTPPLTTTLSVTCRSVPPEDVSPVAREDEDFFITQSTANFAIGSNTASCVLQIRGDDKIPVPTKYIDFQLSDPQSEAPFEIVDPERMRLTIKDNDEIPIISLSDTNTYRIDKPEVGKTTTLPITVQMRTEPEGRQPSGNVTIAYRTLSTDSARPNRDYRHAGGVLTFAPTSTNQTIDLEIPNDSLGTKTFQLEFYDPSGGAILQDASGRSVPRLVADITAMDTDSVRAAQPNPDNLPLSIIQFRDRTYLLPEKDDGSSGERPGVVVELIPADGVSITEVITAQLLLFDGTATRGYDYAGTNEIITFTPEMISTGQTTTFLTMSLPRAMKRLSSH